MRYDDRKREAKRDKKRSNLKLKTVKILWLDYTRGRGVRVVKRFRISMKEGF